MYKRIMVWKRHQDCNENAYYAENQGIIRRNVPVKEALQKKIKFIIVYVLYIISSGYMRIVIFIYYNGLFPT